MKNQNSIFDNFENQKVIISGKIISEPERKSYFSRFILLIETLESDQILIKNFKQEKVIVNTSKYADLNYGDYVIVQSAVKKPENFLNENGLEFDYVNYLAKDKIYRVANNAVILNLEKNHNFNLNKNLFYLKNIFIKKVNELIPSPESELLAGVLLGQKSALGENLEKAFRRVGLIHIVVLSGYNVTIIAEGIILALFFLPKLYSVVVGSFLIILFSIMVGSGATIIRASIMAILALISKVVHRTYNVNKALFLAGTIMLIQNPNLLLHDPSFQLSFLATLGLVNFGRNLSDKIKFLPQTFGLKELTIATLSTQLAVIPLLMKMTGEVSIVSLPVNVITLPFVPPIMFFGFLTGVFAFWEPLNFLAKFFSYITYFGLKYIIEISLWASDFDLAVVKIAHLNFVFILLVYCLIIIFLYYSPIQIYKKIINIFSFTAR